MLFRSPAIGGDMELPLPVQPKQPHSVMDKSTSRKRRHSPDTGVRHAHSAQSGHKLCSLCDLGQSRKYRPALCTDFERRVSGSEHWPMASEHYEVSGRLSSMNMSPEVLSSVSAAEPASLLFLNSFSPLVDNIECFGRICALLLGNR